MRRSALGADRRAGDDAADVRTNCSTFAQTASLRRLSFEGVGRCHLGGSGGQSRRRSDRCSEAATESASPTTSSAKVGAPCRCRRCPIELGRRRHHVYVGHDRQAEGRDHHPRQHRDSALLHQCRGMGNFARRPLSGHDAAGASHRLCAARQFHDTRRHARRHEEVRSARSRRDDRDAKRSRSSGMVPTVCRMLLPQIEADPVEAARRCGVSS